MDLEENRISDPLDDEMEVGEAESPDLEGGGGQAESVADLNPLEIERDEYRDMLQRKQAEFENFRRRITREKEEIRRQAQTELIQDLLPIIDACEKGLESLSEGSSSSPESYREGYELLLKQLQGVLEKYGVAPVPGVGSTFDPNVHEAVIRELSKEFDENEVIEEYRKGYQMGDRLVRPAQVKVSIWPEE